MDYYYKFYLLMDTSNPVLLNFSVNGTLIFKTKINDELYPKFKELADQNNIEISDEQSHKTLKFESKGIFF
jgi:hypothetical protein